MYAKIALAFGLFLPMVTAAEAYPYALFEAPEMATEPSALRDFYDRLYADITTEETAVRQAVVDEIERRWLGAVARGFPIEISPEGRCAVTPRLPGSDALFQPVSDHVFALCRSLLDPAKPAPSACENPPDYPVFTPPLDAQDRVQMYRILASERDCSLAQQPDFTPLLDAELKALARGNTALVGLFRGESDLENQRFDGAFSLSQWVHAMDRQLTKIFTHARKAERQNIGATLWYGPAPFTLIESLDAVFGSLFAEHYTPPKTRFTAATQAPFTPDEDYAVPEDETWFRAYEAESETDEIAPASHEAPADSFSGVLSEIWRHLIALNVVGHPVTCAPKQPFESPLPLGPYDPQACLFAVPSLTAPGAPEPESYWSEIRETPVLEGFSSAEDLVNIASNCVAFLTPGLATEDNERALRTDEIIAAVRECEALQREGKLDEVVAVFMRNVITNARRHQSDALHRVFEDMLDDFVALNAVLEDVRSCSQTVNTKPVVP